MANMYTNTQFPGNLSQNQQDLLMAALQSNQFNGTNVDTINPTSASLDPSMLSTTDGLYDDVDFASFDDSQLFDFLDSNGQPYDAELDQIEANIDNELAAATVSSNGADNGRDKRKSMAEPNSDSDEDEVNPKRREGDEKQAKKPGRKPLTSEPTTKRKAQNRAAQRAFRERKEKHLKDLETKVSELEKTSESTSHENGLLKAQVNSLQNELREYRKRLSMQSSLNTSPRSTGLQSFSTSSDAPMNQFQFDFTQVPYVPYGPLFPNTAISSSPRSTMIDYRSSDGYGSRHGSTDATSPRSNLVNTPGSTEGNRSMHGSISQDSPNAASPPSDGQSNKLRPGSLAHVASDSSSSYNIFTGANITESPKPAVSAGESTGAPTRIFQFNSGSSTSPSASSGSQYGGNGASSSCGTSPEPFSSVNKESTNLLDTIDETSKQREFIDQLGQACGNSTDPIPRAKSLSNTTSAPSMNTDVLTANSNPFQLYGQNQDLFSASWPEFPESNTAIQGDGSFTGGFLNDGPSIFDFASPMNWNDLTGSMRTGLTPAIQKPNPFETTSVLPVVKEEEVVPGEGTMLSCNKVWDAIRQRPDFGDLDIDNLCTELRKKAKCSETGVVIDKLDVDEALQRLPGI